MKWRHTKESESAVLSNSDSQKESAKKLTKDNAKSATTEKTVSEDEEDMEIEVDVWIWRYRYIYNVRILVCNL